MRGAAKMAARLYATRCKTRGLHRAVRSLILTDFTLRARSPWVLRSGTIQAYLRDRYGSGIPKLCPYSDLDKEQIFWMRATKNR